MFSLKKDCSLSPLKLKTEVLKLSTGILGQSNRELYKDLHLSIATYEKHAALNRLAFLPDNRFQDRTSLEVFDWFRGAVLNLDTTANEVVRLASESFMKS